MLVMDKEFALSTIDKLMMVSSSLNDILLDYKNNMPEDEFLKYRKVFSDIMGEIAIELVFPLYKNFPDIAPDWLESEK